MEYNGYQYGYEQPKKTKRSVGMAILLACTAMAVVIGLFAGVLIVNRTIDSRTKTAEQPAISASVTATPASEATGTALNVTHAENAQTSTGFAYDGQYTRAQVVEICAPSVVGIDCIFEQTVSYWGRAQTYEVPGSGSGVVLTADGYIATCAHVVEGAKSIKVTLNDDTSYDASIVGTDTRNDIAIIKIDAQNLTPAALGDSEMLTVGEDVIAIGNPLGELRGTATSGIISAVRRTVAVEGNEMELVQTDAAISPGNSGGGLFNASGKLIGIVNAKVSDSDAEGLGFAIPVNNVLKEINDLLSYGYVTGRAYLGVYTQNVTLRSDYGYFFSSGTPCVQIADVVKDSAADQAGLKTGDLILAVDDHEITSNSDLTDAIARYNAGDTATFTIQRDGSKQSVSVTFGEYAPGRTD
ncbi:MAG: trypsin-like peptidase domain-containing protein [Clostridia bacterium]|jgi:serine protease Do|nr:trypsin-like peptidase domain-containing protein [Clostridia bacterium]MBR3129217.1 trypsin-like peptidase domain-containing protein [Clostridia bacterium]